MFLASERFITAPRSFIAKRSILGAPKLRRLTAGSFFILGAGDLASVEFFDRAALAPKPVAGAPYKPLEDDILSLANKGPQMMQDMQAVDADEGHTRLQSVLKAIVSAVDAAINPHHLTAEQFAAQKENAWAQPFGSYVSADDDSDVPYYAQVNGELRKGKITDADAKWVNQMRQAMWRLPLFQGLSFRGTRLMPARIEALYKIGQLANDAAFVSSSVRPIVAIRFASPMTADQMGPDAASDPTSDLYKIAVIFVIRGKSGRPISYFASSDQREQEILFANGTPMVVTANSAIFKDAKLGNTQIIYLSEK